MRLYRVFGETGVVGPRFAASGPSRSSSGTALAWITMEPTDTVPAADPDRVSALAADAVVDRALSPAAEASLARVVERLPEAMAASDAEARAAAE